MGHVHGNYTILYNDIQIIRKTQKAKTKFFLHAVRCHFAMQKCCGARKAPNFYSAGVEPHGLLESLVHCVLSW